MDPNNAPRTVVGREFKHGVYVTAKDGTEDDVVVVKEYLIYNDGTRTPHLDFRLNEKRKFWVTRKQHRNHRDKKFAEEIDKLQVYESTQARLVESIARVLERGVPQRNSLQSICRSPYVYGCDVTTPVLMKYNYARRWPQFNGDNAQENTIAAIDIEANMYSDRKEPIMVSLAMIRDGKIDVYLQVTRQFIESEGGNAEATFQKALVKYLGHLVESEGLRVVFEIAKDPGEACYKAIMKAHEWQPDFLDVWNMNYDIKEIVKTLEEYGYDPKVVFSDPRVPPHFRHFKYREGKASKLTASGKQMTLHFAEQWHVAECPASFFIIDSMCVYLRLRIAGGKEPSYSLDSVLKKHGLGGKLTFTEAEEAGVPDGGPMWHLFMQKFQKIAYCVYNVYDSVSLLLLDRKTTDLARQITTMSGPSEYERFSSQPRRTCDDLHFVCIDKGYVIATTSDQMEDENDKYTVSLKNWIVTLRSDLVADNGVRAVLELPNYNTNLRVHVADLDVAGTYPNEQVLMNISKETTSREVCRIRGKSEALQRAVGINLSGGYVNAVEICSAIYGVPSMDRMLQDFRAHIGEIEIVPDTPTNLSEQMRIRMEDYVMIAEEEEEEEEDDEENAEDEEAVVD